VIPWTDLNGDLAAKGNNAGDLSGKGQVLVRRHSNPVSWDLGRLAMESNTSLQRPTMTKVPGKLYGPLH
jgi:hypothetical protein